MSEQRGRSPALVGVGFWQAMGITFVVLKLAGVIDWSWWLVLLPLYGPVALALLILALALAAYLVAALLMR